MRPSRYSRTSAATTRKTTPFEQNRVSKLVSDRGRTRRGVGLSRSRAFLPGRLNGRESINLTFGPQPGRRSWAAQLAARVGLLCDLLRLAGALPDDHVVAAGVDDVLDGAVFVTRTDEEKR